MMVLMVMATTQQQQQPTAKTGKLKSKRED